MSGGGGGSDTTTTRVQVPGFLRGFADQGTNVAGGALSGLQSQLGGATAQDLVAPLNQQQLSSFDIGTQAAQGGLSDIQDRLTGVATGQAGGPGLEALQRTASGDFLHGGSGFDAAVDAAFRSAQPRIFSQFGGAGRLDSGLAREAVASAFADPFAAQFGQERGRQINAANALLGRQAQAAQLAPFLAQQRFGLQSEVGNLLQQQAQQEIQAPITAQQQLLAASGGAIPAGAFLGSSATAPVGGPSPIAAGLGGALTGGATGAQIGAAGGPIGAGTGALIGGGLGLLGALG